MKETAYLLQAALVSAWWLGLASSSTFFAAFQFNEISATAFWAFFAPDVLLIAGGSTVRAYHKSSALEYVVLGAFGYATLYCINATVLTVSGFLPSGLMFLGLVFNGFLCFNESLFRTSSSNLIRNTGKTLIQVTCVWLLALVVVPYVILEAFDAQMVPASPMLLAVGSCVFLVSSALGLMSAFFIVKDGDGTPLPLDQTNKLVLSGPYRYVRNPMAIAGIGQGIALAVVFRSVPLLVYSILGAVVWHLVVRPVEEKDMIERFGETYVDYRQRVSCWVPTFRATAK